MTQFIPKKQGKGIRVGNRGDILGGNIIKPRNLDFNKRGYISLARKPYVMVTETQEANLESPIAVVIDDDNIYMVTSDNVIRIDPSSSDLTISDETTGTTPGGGFQADGVFFNQLLHVSDTAGVHYLSSGTWEQALTGLSSSYPHPLCVSEHQNFLAVGNGNSVDVYNTSYVSQATMTVPAGHVITWIRWRGGSLWCGSRHINGGEAKVFAWNGSGTASQASYGVGGDWAFSGCVYPGTIIVCSSTGQLLRFAGDDFIPLRTDAGDEVAFPNYWANRPWGSSSSTSNLIGKIASRGMESKGRLIYMVVDSDIATAAGGYPDFLPGFNSGMWVFDPSIGLYHKAGVDHEQRKTVNVSTLTSDELTIDAAAVFETGDPVHVVNNSLLTGVDNLVYYAIKTDSTHLKLAATPQQALDGDNIAIGGTVGTADLLFNVYESVGAMKVSRAGGLAVIKSLTIPTFTGIEVVYSAEPDNATGTSIGAVMSLGMGKNVGSFQTPKIQAENFTDVFKKIMAKFPPIYIPSRKIIVKYRIVEKWGLPGRQAFDNGTLTWVDSTSFTVNPLTYDVYNVSVGDEVEFLYKGAAGYTAHITDITVDSSTQWTFTIDEEMPDVTASDTTRALFDNWTKYKTISTTDDEKAAATGLKKMLIAKRAKWIELKIELRGYTDMVETMDLEEVMLLTGADQKYA